MPPSSWPYTNTDTGGELSALLGTPEFMRLTLTQEWGFDEFATNVNTRAMSRKVAVISCKARSCNIIVRAHRHEQLWCLSSAILEPGVPRGVSLHYGVQDREELAHSSRYGHFLGFSSPQQSLIEGFDDRVTPCRGERGHV